MSPYPLIPSQIRVLVCPMRLAPSLLMHARARSHRATHSQVPREAGPHGPWTPSSAESATPRTSQRGPADSCVLSRCRCRAVIYFETSLISSRRGKEERGWTRALPLATPAFHGTQQKSSRPAACGSGPRNAGPAAILLFGGGSGGSTAVSNRLELPTAM